MRSRRPLVFGNWKMNGTGQDALDLAGAIAAHGRLETGMLAVFPPFTQLREVARHLHGTGILVGAQDCHESANGAFTGSVSARMIADAGATGVIVGHSERRQGLGESDALVLAKVQAAISAGLATVVVCIGETEAEHAESRTLEVLHAQIEGSLPSDVDTGRLVLAYEPVWAIGTGRMPTAAEVGHVHGQLRAKLVDYLDGDGAAVPILYGGSVKSSNAATMLAIVGVDGALVGGASLDAAEFVKIFMSGGGRFAPPRS